MGQIWPQLLVKWMPNESLTLQNFVYYFHAHRTWMDAETYTFTTVDLNGSPLPSPQINRDRFYVFRFRFPGDPTWMAGVSGPWPEGELLETGPSGTFSDFVAADTATASAHLERIAGRATL